ncbi:MAG: ferrochelatase [Candidatus Sericytochromatia bacterium]|nr:ferrochelatase [Candidatus Sericytochromatia bacterium]
MSVAPALLARLAEAEARLRARVPVYRSLAPGRGAPTPWPALASRLLPGQPPGRQAAWVAALTAIGAAQAEAFPETLFWDADALAASLLREAADAAGLQALGEAHVALHHRFARGGAIAFRYTHDFTYGFDWARWVARDPAGRAGHGPYSLAFVQHMARRGEELLALIAANDATYPALPGGGPRNPFAFSREPAAEARLLEALAAAGEVPATAWDPAAAPRWERPFAALREARARQLGLADTVP